MRLRDFVKRLQSWQCGHPCCVTDHVQVRPLVQYPASRTMALPLSLLSLQRVWPGVNTGGRHDVAGRFRDEGSMSSASRRSTPRRSVALALPAQSEVEGFDRHRKGHGEVDVAFRNMHS